MTGTILERSSDTFWFLRQAVRRNFSSRNSSWLNPSLPYGHRGLISKLHSHNFNYGKINCSKKSPSPPNEPDSHNYISDRVLIRLNCCIAFGNEWLKGYSLPLLLKFKFMNNFSPNTHTSKTLRKNTLWKWFCVYLPGKLYSHRKLN